MGPGTIVINGVLYRNNPFGKPIYFIKPFIGGPGYFLCMSLVVTFLQAGVQFDQPLRKVSIKLFLSRVKYTIVKP